MESRWRNRLRRSTLVRMTDTPITLTISSQADLENAWRNLMGPWSFGGHSVWMMLIVDEEPIPQITEIAEAEDLPDEAMLAGLADILRMLQADVAPGARVAFLRSRPGLNRVTDDDRRWAIGLYDAARRAGVECEVIHLATRGSIRPLPQDEVGFTAEPA